MVTDDKGGELLYGLCGTTMAHGTNPLTGETKEIALHAGEKLTVYLHDGTSTESAESQNAGTQTAGNTTTAGTQSESGSTIEFKIEKVSEKDLPEEVLRLYADNPELLAQACKEAEWDEKIIAERIRELKEKENVTYVQQSGLQVEAGSADRLMQDLTTCPITVSTGSASKEYDGTALTAEGSITGLAPDETAEVKTASQTKVGSTSNTYEIEWGTAKSSNYIVSEGEIGTLTVTKRIVTVNLGGGTKDVGGNWYGPVVTATFSDGSAVEYVSEEGYGGDDTHLVEVTSQFWLGGEDGNDCLIVEVPSYKEPGTFTITPTRKDFNGDADYYDISYTNATLVLN